VAASARLRIELRASRSLTLLLGAAHLLAAVLSWVLPLSPWLSALLTALIGWSLWHALRLHALRSAPRAIVALAVEQNGRAELELRSGASIGARVLQDTFVTALLVVINQREEESGRRRSVVLATDSADAASLRALRVWLRFKVELV
jgi:hypothetical protein